MFAFGALFACGDDDFEEKPSAFLGTTWELIHEYQYEDEFGAIVKCKEVLVLMFLKDDKVMQKGYFYENGEKVEEESDEATYSVDGNKISIKVSDGDEVYTLIGIVDGNKLTITDEGETFVFNKK